jgi:hypothetical protein
MTEVKALVGGGHRNLKISRWPKMTDDSRGIVGSWEVGFPEARTS